MVTEKVLVQDTFRYEGWIYNIDVEILARRVSRGSKSMGDPRRRYAKISLDEEANFKEGRDVDEDYPVNLTTYWSNVVHLEELTRQGLTKDWLDIEDPKPLYEQVKNLLECMKEDWEEYDEPMTLLDLIEKIELKCDMDIETESV